uniref:Uncharacterized protein n=1 Tax=Arundo donax TaxID=35708 RepID=A0A0A9GEK7_ARUDO
MVIAKQQWQNAQTLSPLYLGPWRTSGHQGAPSPAARPSPAAAAAPEDPAAPGLPAQPGTGSPGTPPPATWPAASPGPTARRTAAEAPLPTTVAKLHRRWRRRSAQTPHGS